MRNINHYGWWKIIAKQGPETEVQLPKCMQYTNLQVKMLEIAKSMRAGDQKQKYNSSGVRSRLVTVVTLIDYDKHSMNV